MDKYGVEYGRDEKGDDLFNVVDYEGMTLASFAGPTDADALVDHLLYPRPGSYSIHGDAESDIYDLLDPDGDHVVSIESLAVLEDLLTHLHRNA